MEFTAASAPSRHLLWQMVLCSACKNATSGQQKYAATPHFSVNTVRPRGGSLRNTCAWIHFLVGGAGCGQLRAMELWVQGALCWVNSPATFKPSISTLQWAMQKQRCQKPWAGKTLRCHCDHQGFSYAGGVLGSENKLREQLHNQS